MLLPPLQLLSSAALLSLMHHVCDAATDLNIEVTQHQDHMLCTGEEDRTSGNDGQVGRFRISKDDAVTIAIALAASTLIRT